MALRAGLSVRMGRKDLLDRFRLPHIGFLNLHISGRWGGLNTHEISHHLDSPMNPRRAQTIRVVPYSR
jgi:hypothetical protein